MATQQPSPDGGGPPAADLTAAQPLADALRRARLTLLCGEAGAGKSCLLVDGLLPLLRRRQGDASVRVTRQLPPTVLPFPDRRKRGDRAALAEFVIVLNAWESASVERLHDGIDTALRAAHLDPEWYREPLTERVQSLASRFGTRFLFVLDGFDAVLRAADADPACAHLLDELVHLLNTSLPVNLLIALRSDAELLLAPLLARLHSVRAEVFMLEGGRTRRVYGAATPVPAAAPATAKPQPTELSQFDRADMPEAANTGAPTRPGELGATPPGAVEPMRPAPPLKTRPRSARQRRLTTQRLVALASVALVAIVGAAAMLRVGLPSGDYPPLATAPKAEAIPAAPAAALPTPTLAVPTPRPGFALRIDADSAETRLPRELAQALAADGRADVRVVPTQFAVPGRAAGSPDLAVVRYDALQAAARAGGARPELAVVAPLYTEELQIVVRADSPLRFIHQIEGRRIDIGAAQGARAVTARALYRQMFGRPLPANRQTQLDDAAALQALIAGDGLDAVVLVGAQPAAALAALPPAQRRTVRLLALAPDNPASRRALQSYLPASLREPAGSTTPTLAALSFLVTTGRPDADTAARLGQLATSLCRQLPTLQRDGDAKWRELRAGLQLDTGWPPAGAADAAWRACAGTSSAASSSTTPTRH